LIRNFTSDQIQLNSMEFRIIIGQSASILTAGINKNTPWRPDKYLEFIELRANADYLWLKMEVDVTDLKNDELTPRLEYTTPTMKFTD